MGLSGKNIEYLLNLVDVMRKIFFYVYDFYLFELEVEVLKFCDILRDS